MKGNFAAKLKKLSKTWKAAKERANEGGGQDEFEDGRYLAKIVGAEIGESANSGRSQIDWSYKILEGDYKDKVKHDYAGLDTEMNQMFVAQAIAKLGYEVPDEMEDLDEILKEIVKEKPIVRIRLKTKGEFQNVTLDKVLGKDEASEAEEEAEPAEEQEEVSAEEEEVELKKGMAVIATLKSGDKEATVLAVLEEEGKVKVKIDDDSKIYVLSADKIAVPAVEEEEAAEEEETEDDEVPEEPAEEEESEEEEEEEEEQPKKAKKVVKKTPPAKKGKK